MQINRSISAVKPDEDPDWVSREFGGADLGDARRDTRLVGWPGRWLRAWKFRSRKRWKIELH